MSFFNSIGRMGRKNSAPPTPTIASPTTAYPNSSSYFPSNSNSNNAGAYSSPDASGAPSRPRKDSSSKESKESREAREARKNAELIMNYPVPAKSMLFLTRPFVDATLVKGSLKTLVSLPKYLDVMEWVAVNMFDFYNNINLFYGAIAEKCTLQSCPTMTAGDQLVYTWVDANHKHVKLPAATYIDFIFTWVQNLLEDQNIFPTKSGTPFPSNFPATCKHMYRQMLRVFAHMYQAHFQDILNLRIEPHINSLFAHYLAFGAEFDVLDKKELKGSPSSPTGIGYLYERWKEDGRLD